MNNNFSKLSDGTTGRDIQDLYTHTPAHIFILTFLLTFIHSVIDKKTLSYVSICLFIEISVLYGTIYE